jgi:hypothetical protein
MRRLKTVVFHLKCFTRKQLYFSKYAIFSFNKSWITNTHPKFIKKNLQCMFLKQIDEWNSVKLLGWTDSISQSRRLSPLLSRNIKRCHSLFYKCVCQSRSCQVLVYDVCWVLSVDTCELWQTDSLKVFKLANKPLKERNEHWNLVSDILLEVLNLFLHYHRTRN